MVLLNDIIFAKCALEHICHSFSFYYFSLLLMLQDCFRSFCIAIKVLKNDHQNTLEAPKTFITVWSKDAFHL